MLNVARDFTTTLEAIENMLNSFQNTFRERQAFFRNQIQSEMALQPDHLAWLDNELRAAADHIFSGGTLNSAEQTIIDIKQGLYLDFIPTFDSSVYRELTPTYRLWAKAGAKNFRKDEEVDSLVQAMSDFNSTGTEPSQQTIEAADRLRARDPLNSFLASFDALIARSSV